MSEKTFQAVQDAIQAHLREEEGDVVLTDWVVGYAGVCTNDGHHIGYLTSTISPHGALGVGRITIRALEEDLLEVPDDA